MAYPTPVNSMITDSVTQQAVAVLAAAPAMAMGSIYQTAAHSIGIAYENAVQAQRQASISSQAATNQGVIQVYSLGGMSTAVATNRSAKHDTVRTLLTLLLSMEVAKRL